MPSDETTPSCATCKSWSKATQRQFEAPSGHCRRMSGAGVVATNDDATVEGGGLFRTGASFCCTLYHRIGDYQ